MPKFVLYLLFFLTWIVNCGANGGCNNPCVTAADIHERCSGQEIGQKCYYKFYNLTNWQENKELCQGQGLEMVRLTKETIPHMAKLEFDATFKRPSMCDAGMWLAGRAVEKWAFLNDTDVRETEILVEPPGHVLTHVKDPSCGYMRETDFMVKLGYCIDKKYFVCRNDVNEFVAFKEKKTWFKARETCIQTGGDLFYLKKDEFDFESIKNLTISALGAANITADDFFHIGAVHRIWMWPGGDHITAYNWNELEPSNYLERCLMFYDNGKWNDEFCSAMLSSFCQGDVNESPRQQKMSATEVAMEDRVTQKTTATDECYHSCLDTTRYFRNPRCLYKQIGEHCYYLFTGYRSKTWLQTKTLCREQALEMVQLSEESIPHITSLVFTNPNTRERSCLKERAWLGGKAKNLDKWSFLNRQNVIPSSYAIKTGDYHKCGYMYMVTGNIMLETGSCYDKEYFLCRDDENGLKAFKEKKTWFKARETCLRDGGDLFYMYPADRIVEEVHSALENASISLRENFHVSLVHRIWQWQNGEQIVSSNWGIREPNDHGEGCLEAHTRNGNWNDYGCERKIHAVCQRNLASPSSRPEEERTQSPLTPGRATPVRTTPGRATPVTAGSVRPTQGGSNLDNSASGTAPACTTPSQVTTHALLGVFALGCVILLAYILVSWYHRKTHAYGGLNLSVLGIRQRGNEEQIRLDKDDSYASTELDDISMQ